MKTGTLTASASCCWKIALNPQLVAMALPYAPVPVVTMDTDGTVRALVGMVAWVIGAYIHDYELHGADRADYGDRLLPKLAERLGNEKMVRTQERELRRYRAFYVAYPQIRESVSPESGAASAWAIRESASPEFGALLAGATLPSLLPRSGVPGQTLLERLSFSHFAELLAIEDPLQRAFYELECIRGNWSVRALKRQISSLYFERSGLSLDKDKRSVMAHAAAEQIEPRLAIRDPYIFEFLGLKPSEAVAESDLEQAMLANLQEFLLELGHGFCLEARQKSMLIGQTRGFVDLVFYHRVLKCHVLVELKVDAFRHEHIGQLNTYVAWFQKNMMQEGDNPPVGLLLCTGKDHAKSAATSSPGLYRLLLPAPPTPGDQNPSL